MIGNRRRNFTTKFNNGHHWQSRVWLIVPLLLIISLLIYGLFSGIIQSLGWVPAFQMRDLSLKYLWEMIHDKRFLKALGYSMKISAISSTLSVLIGLMVCYVILLLSDRDQQTILRYMRIPIIIPHVIVSMFMIQLFSRTGIFSRISHYVGMDNAMAFWGKWVFDRDGRGVILAYLWKGIPFVIFTCLPIMSRISDRLGQAARVLGANNFQSFWHITMPLCWHVILVDHMILMLFALGAYDLPKILGATFPKALPILAYEAYIHPDLTRRPYAMAMNALIFIIGLVMLCLYGLLLKSLRQEKRRRDDDETSKVP